MIRRIVHLLVPLVSACSFARADGPIPKTEISLGGPLVSRLDWGTHSVQAVDVDGDGLRDIALVNGDRSAIEILYQNRNGQASPARSLETTRWDPVVEDAPYRKGRVTVSTNVFDLVVGDISGDGRADLVYTGETDALTLRVQKNDGTFSELRVPEAPAPQPGVGSIRLADIDADGKLDFVMLGQKEVAVFRQKSEGGLGSPDRYPLADDGCYGLEIVDTDGDDRPDILYLVSGSRDPVRVRRQTAGHQFGAEVAYAIKPTRCTLQILPPSGPKQQPTFGFAQDNTGHFEEFRLVESREAVAGNLSLRPRLFSPRPAGKTPSAYALADLNGDGLLDVAVSDPDGAQLFVYLRQKEGGFTLPVSFPVMADVRSLAAMDWDKDGQTELFLASPKEQVVGVARWKDGRLSYPLPLVTGGKPLGLAALAATGELALLREEGGKRSVEVWRHGAEGPRSVEKFEFAAMKADPRGIRWMDTNQDGRQDLLVFSPFEAMRILVRNEAGAFADASLGAGYRRGLVENLDSSALNAADLNGDGREEMLIQAGGYVRALRLDDKGQLVVLDQINARDAANEISATLVVAKGAQPTVVLLEKKTEQFQVLAADERGLYRVKSSHPAGKIDVVGSTVRFEGASPVEAFVYGRDRFWWLPLGQPDLQAATVATYATDLPNISYSDVVAGDLNDDGIPEMVCNDPGKNMIEILSRTQDGAWASRMHFKVFEVDEHFQGRKGGPFEPRETVIADVTGDGKKDLILLVHDRILVYPQQ